MEPHPVCVWPGDTGMSSNKNGMVRANPSTLEVVSSSDPLDVRSYDRASIHRWEAPSADVRHRATSRSMADDAPTRCAPTSRSRCEPAGAVTDGPIWGRDTTSSFQGNKAE